MKIYGGDLNELEVVTGMRNSISDKAFCGELSLCDWFTEVRHNGCIR